MFHDWIEFFEFMPGDSDSKTPMDFDLLFVAPFFPRADLATQHISVVQPATKALMYRSTVFWTPSGLQLGCSSQGTPLLLSHLGRGFVSMPSDQPGLIVLTLERVQRQAQLFHGIKGCEP